VVVDEVLKLPSLLNEIHDALASASRGGQCQISGRRSMDGTVAVLVSDGKLARFGLPPRQP
jgi:hypothetical protein